MKVLFAVSNEEISEQIVKKYQKEYKEIISFKNVYYFNAILKELQKDKTYDRVVISEDLETFASTQYEQIDKFIFEKLDSISDEASNVRGNDIPIILICSDRRTKSEPILVKLFGIGIYDALIGNDRSFDEVCKLIYKPRSKKEAKIYYKIDSDDVNYQAENENDVSEMEIQNIVAHYKRLGNNEEKYIDSFNNIAAQYNDTQLRIITKFLPINVRAVLEEKSSKYQQIMSFNNSVSNSLRYAKEEKTGPTETLLKQASNEKPISEPIVIPSSVNIQGSRKLSRKKSINAQTEQTNKQQNITNTIQNTIIPKEQNVQKTPIEENPIEEQNTNEQINNTTQQTEKQNEIVEPVKRRRGRPRKNPVEVEKNVEEVKRGRGRPKKNTTQETNIIQEEQNIIPEFSIQEQENLIPGFDMQEQENLIPGFDMQEQENLISGFGMQEQENLISGFNEEEQESIIPGFGEEEQESILPGFGEEEQESIIPGFGEEKQESIIPGFNEEEQESIIPGFNEEEQESIIPGFDEEEQENMVSKFEMQQPKRYTEETRENINNSQFNATIPKFENIPQESTVYNQNRQEGNSNYSQMQQYESNRELGNFLGPDKKIATFVGTSKNGTSFIVNNLAEYISTVMGIKTAILDTTKNRNSYYIYTKNEDKLRDIASKSIEGLARGTAQGINVNKNLTVYTSLPDEENLINYTDEILETLVKNYSVVLIDSDFDTPLGYFKQTQELYLVQTLDILTIQPLTAFLRELKAKNILDERKLRIILNKVVKIRGVSEKTIIGGMAYYNDPAMSFMTELFDRNTIKYISIPFDEQIYIKYLQGIIENEVSLKGYAKSFGQTLGQLANMLYPIVSKKNKKSSATDNNAGNGFSPNMNNTLEQMRKKF